MSVINNNPPANPAIARYEYSARWWIDDDANPLKKGAMAIYLIIKDFFKFIANLFIGASNFIHGYEEGKTALGHEIPKKDWFEEYIKNPPISTTHKYDGPVVAGGHGFVGLKDPFLFGAEEEDVFEPKALPVAPDPEPVITGSTEESRVKVDDNRDEFDELEFDCPEYNILPLNLSDQEIEPPSSEHSPKEEPRPRELQEGYIDPINLIVKNIFIRQSSIPLFQIHKFQRISA